MFSRVGYFDPRRTSFARLLRNAMLRNDQTFRTADTECQEPRSTFDLHFNALDIIASLCHWTTPSVRTSIKQHAVVVR